MSTVPQIDSRLAGRERLPEWRALETHAMEMKSLHLRDQFARDPERGSRFMASAGPLLLDFSKQRVEVPTLRHLGALARVCRLSDAIQQLFSGERVNLTENRAALHTALRSPVSINPLTSKNVQSDIQKTLSRVEEVVNRIHRRQWRGYSGKPIRDIVNIGVGGSDLGPFMACFALDDFRAPAAQDLNFHFASSMDGTQVSHLLKRLNPETTLFIVSSKSFTTIDTLSNAATAFAWLGAEVSDNDMLMRQHVIGISASPEKMSAWGIPEQNQLHLWDWVGGRYSMWSAIGLPIALKLGMDGFRQVLAGAHFMDEHFRQTPFEKNLPMLMGAISVWNSTFMGINTHAVLPYDGRLKYLPAYLSQLEMESNGKSVGRNGEKVNFSTCPVLWGDVGPNAQHAFYQLLHQGTQPVSSMFIAAINRYEKVHNGPELEALQRQQNLSLANCLAQTRVLALGDSAIAGADDMPAYKRYAGNQPSSTLLLDELNPFTLGALIAAYEHKVFVMSVFWDINPFDQWGVELGKKIASDMQSVIESGDAAGLDSSSAELVKAIRAKMLNQKN